MLRGVTLALLLAAAGALKLGCIGDSITAGVCSQTTGGYPAVLQKLLGTSWEVKNFGNSGKTMLKYGGPGDSSYWNQTTWRDAQAYNADIYTILLGTNDAKTFNWFPCTGPNGTDCSWVGGDNYTADYVEMINILKALPSRPRIFIMSPPPLYPPFPFSMNKTVINYVIPSVILPAIAKQSAAEPLVIDLFDALGGAGLTQPGITCDGCHPVDKGYEEMAQAMFKVLSKIQA
eukprot:m.29766 g.29766  ORF g.29766 m.29766 type:complete len:232 (-) comp4695_c0_seq1:74-769(-)